ncbi:hypothetical protein CK220_26755 [Mesorhizobium sp. WSM3860]|nr:hypothetical protein CK220_26755 [Mesorhizobium sp. WSM3860]
MCKCVKKGDASPTSGIRAGGTQRGQDMTASASPDTTTSVGPDTTTSVGVDTLRWGTAPLCQFEKHRKIPSKAENWVRRESVRSGLKVSEESSYRNRPWAYVSPGEELPGEELEKMHGLHVVPLLRFGLTMMGIYSTSQKMATRQSRNRQKLEPPVAVLPLIRRMRK